jgi:hypothetical protein
MSITNYSELKTAVENWLDRSDLTDRIPEFIELAEYRIRRLLKSRGIEGRAYTPLVSGQEYYQLPSDYVSCRNIQINSNPITKLEYRTPEQIDSEYPTSYTGTPAVFTIIGEEIQIKPIPNMTNNLEISYYKEVTALSDSNTTNWTITNAPELLLFGALIEAEAYLINDPRIPIWKSSFDEAMSFLNGRENQGRYSGSNLQIRTSTGNP